MFAGILAFAVVKAQGPRYDPENFIEWNEFYNLRWDDFQGRRAEGRFGDAGTAVQIKAKPYLVKKKVKYDVYVLFDKKKSWSSDTSDALLAHERLHFDIAELYARKVRKKISEMSDEQVNDVKKYNAAIQVILDESNDADQQYDRETLHGAFRKEQAAWQKKIKDELLALEDFKKPQRVVMAP